MGKSWFLLAVVAVLLVPTVITHRQGHHLTNRIFGIAIAGLISAAMVYSIVRLVLFLPYLAERHISAAFLLRAALVLWLTNVLVFALWYWQFDAGGPHRRDLRAGHPDGAFLFPQMTMDADAKTRAGQTDWSPGFIDYLFLAFNTSTALSPTDTPPLSHWAKVLMMVQALISLTIIALLAARAVNIL